MERLISVLESLRKSRFLPLYGTGINDSFMLSNVVEGDLNHALVQPLNSLGYTRIIYSSPTEPIYFLDEQSRQLSKSFLWLGDGDPRSTNPFQSMKPGPFGNRIILPGQTQDVNFSFESLGDTHLLRILDAAMREANGPPTVVVINQAEIYIQNSQDQRTLSSILDLWLSLPSSNHNRCILLFSANTYSELAEIATGLPVPGIRSLILSEHGGAKKQSPAIELGGPHRDEAARLVNYMTRNKWTDFDPDFIDGLVDLINIESHPLQTWTNRMMNQPFIDRSLALKSGWFSHFQGATTPAIDRLNDLIGLADIKKRILELAGWAANRNAMGIQSKPLLHMVFSGNPGTGKTTVARLTGELFFDMKILKKGHLVEVKAQDLIAEHVGGTAIKTNQVIDSARDGILFIDEAYSLTAKDRGGFGAEAIETLLTRMEDDRGDLVVVLSGYPDPIRDFLKSNPGISRRFPGENRMEFPDFNNEELDQILTGDLESRGMHHNAEVLATLKLIVHGLAGQSDKNFGNAGEIRNFVDSLERKCLSRNFLKGKKSNPILTMDDISPDYKKFLPVEIPPTDTILAELDNLVGLEDVKNFVKKKITRLQFEKIRSNKPASQQIQHLIFTGNPGTGKTTVARLMGRIYASLGLLHKGHTVEVSMPDLIAGYVGQTTGKVIEQVDKAIDGVLFIDEAYALVRGNSLFQGSFGQEVIDTLVKAIEDHRGRLLVILAGYSREMDTLIRSNPGLKSRFASKIGFPDFSTDDMAELLDRLLVNDHLTIQDEARQSFISRLENRKSADPVAFGNARDVISAYEGLKDRLAERIINQVGQSKIKSNDLKDRWIEIIVEDVADTDFTVVIDATENDKRNQKPAVKSWVVPKE